MPDTNKLGQYFGGGLSLNRDSGTGGSVEIRRRHWGRSDATDLVHLHHRFVGSGPGWAAPRASQERSSAVAVI